MPRQQIVSPRIGKPSGHFSHTNAIEARGRIVFISGMTSKAAGGTVVGVGDIEAQPALGAGERAWFGPPSRTGAPDAMACRSR